MVPGGNPWRGDVIFYLRRNEEAMERTGAVRAELALHYSPALIEDEIRTYPLDAFDFLEDEAYLPLANGLIGLGGDGSAFKNTRSVHLAARVAPSDA